MLIFIYNDNQGEKMKYLIEINKSLYGYNNPVLLLINILEIKPENYRIFRKAEGLFIDKYENISLDVLRYDCGESEKKKA